MNNETEQRINNEIKAEYKRIHLLRKRKELLSTNSGIVLDIDDIKQENRKGDATTDKVHFSYLKKIRPEQFIRKKKEDAPKGDNFG